MKIYEYPSKDNWPELIRRPATNDLAIEQQVRQILLDVKKQGDAAVKKYSRLFDKKIKSPGTISASLKQAIKASKKNIEFFHAAQHTSIEKIETLPGVCCWQENRPIEKVGLYIPGGSAPLFSTILMLAIPAKLAGCKEIVLCCPSDHPAIAWTAKLCGITEIQKIGGSQAIAAMAYGTKTVPKVQKIFGPGNKYVTMAKQLVQLDGVAIDMPAGPSELLIIADDSADPDFVATDLLAQAEHGEDSQTILLSTDLHFLKTVRYCLSEYAKRLSRKVIAEAALQNGRMILVASLEEALSFSNDYAPEHLSICCRNAERYVEDVTSAGAVFIGNYSPCAAGDYASGTNHTLPTNGYAAMAGGVSVESFLKKISFQQLSQEGLREVGNTVMTMAEAEGLDAHKKSIEIRL